MNVQILKLATNLVISVLLLRQAASEDEIKRKYKYLPAKLLVYAYTICYL
jgi:hypothetical protein